MVDKDEAIADTKYGEDAASAGEGSAGGDIGDSAIHEEVNGTEEAGERLDEEAGRQQGPYGDPRKFHVPVVIAVFLLIVVALDIVCMVRFPKVIDDYRIYKQAEDRIEKGETSAVMEDFYNMVEKHPDSVPILVKFADLSMENGYYDAAGYVINEYLVGKEVEDEEYDRINDYYGKLDSYYNAYDAVEQILSEAPGEGMTEEAYAANIKERLEGLLGQGDMDQAYIYYYLGYIEGKDMAAARDYMQLCYDNDPNCFDVRVQLGVMYRRLGDMGRAKWYVEEALNKDQQDTGALRAMSTIALAEGGLEEGLQYAKAAYDLYPEGTYVRDTYLIALHANGKSVEEQDMKEELSGLGQALEADTVSFLKDEITLQEYYIGE